MKTLPIIGALAVLLIFQACTKEDTSTRRNEEVPNDVLQKIKALGFSTENVVKYDNHYVVEGDIMLSQENLERGPASKTLLRIAGEEHYRTFNLVTGLPRTITVTTNGPISPLLSFAINQAIARYNAENLGLTFVRGGSSGGGDIDIFVFPPPLPFIAAAGFPDDDGNPFQFIVFNSQFTSGVGPGFLTTVVAHEIGHCIGFRHTDYMDRSFSCGGAPDDEGDAGIGAVHIPGTPTGPDPTSWMLSCIGINRTDRPFNANDKIALRYLYGL